MLYALTLHQPWASMVAYAGKDVENRGTRPPASLLGKYMAVHAGLTWDEDGARGLREVLGLEVPERERHPFGAIIAVARVTGCVEKSQSRWFAGPYGWQLADVRAIAPVLCRGMPGVFVPPKEVADAVRFAWKAAVRLARPATTGEQLLVSHATEFAETVQILMTEGDLDADAAEWRALTHLLMEVAHMGQVDAEREAARTIAGKRMRAVDEQVKAARAARGVH